LKHLDGSLKSLPLSGVFKHITTQSEHEGYNSNNDNKFDQRKASGARAVRRIFEGHRHWE
jgi:hypothetical protein